MLPIALALLAMVMLSASGAAEPTRAAAPSACAAQDRKTRITVHGNAGDDRIFGGNSALMAFGDEDNDFISGSNKGDDINGGPGRDRLVGGVGADAFIYERAADSPADRRGQWSPDQDDTIVDFMVEDGDKIDLSSVVREGPNGDQRLRWTGIPEPYGVWAGVRNGDTLVMVESTGDNRADMVIRLLGRISLKRTDFCGLD
jgi:serralysin